MAPTPVIRRLLPADVAGYRTLMLEGYASAPDAFTSAPGEREALPMDWWMARVSDQPGAIERVIGALVDGQLVGAAGLRVEQRPRTSHKANLFGMYLRPAFRRTGIARSVVDEVLRQAAATGGVEVVQLSVSETNIPAIRLYTGAGFMPYGTEPFAMKLGDGYMAKIHMWRRVSGADR